MYGVRFGLKVILSKDCVFKGYNYVGNNSEFGFSQLGTGSYIANNSQIRYTKIGNFCSIGDNVRTYVGRHPVGKHVSSHPCFYNEKNPSSLNTLSQFEFNEHIYLSEDIVVNIGNDVWIGNNVLIMDGITVGDGAVIAAGSIVTKDVMPYEVVGGIPARYIKHRFQPKSRELLMSVQWWNWELEKIITNKRYFEDIDYFTDYFTRNDA